MRTSYEPPANEADFELLCLELLRREWDQPQLELYAHRGEIQHGVDIFSSSGETPHRAGQCKLHRPDKTIPPHEIRNEVKKVTSFPHQVDHYCILTTARKSKQTQDAIREINDIHRANGQFLVELMTWDVIVNLIDRHPDVRNAYYNTISGETTAKFERRLSEFQKSIEHLSQLLSRVIGSEVSTVEILKHHLDSTAQRAAIDTAHDGSKGNKPVLPVRFHCGFPTGTSAECPYMGPCNETSALTMLRGAFGRHVRVTLVESTDNLVIRSEQLTDRNDEECLCLRKHLHEVEGENERRFLLVEGNINEFVARLHYLRQRNDQPMPTCDEIEHIRRKLVDLLDRNQAPPHMVWWDPNEFRRVIKNLLSDIGLSPVVSKGAMNQLEWCATSPFACFPVNPQTCLGEYLGFADLRTYSSISPLSIGLLVPPRALRNDHKAMIVDGYYGQTFNARAFRSTVYSMIEPNTMYCGQACLIMALSMLSDRGTTPFGAKELTALANQDLAVTDKNNPIARSENEPAIRGLYQGEIVNILNHRACNASADGVFMPDDVTNRRLAKRLLDAYISARCPVIVLGDAGKWWNLPVNDKRSGHAVVVVGTRRGSPSETMHARENIEEITEVIIHDPGYGPFVVRPVDEFLDGSVALGPISGQSDGGFNIVFAADAKTKRHARNCVDALRRHDYQNWIRFIAVPSTTNFKLRSKQEEIGVSIDTDYEIRLVHRDDISRAYGCAFYDLATARKLLGHVGSDESDSGLAARFRLLEDAAKELDRGWYWCISGFEKASLQTLWLFSAQGDDNSYCDCYIDLMKNQIKSPDSLIVGESTDFQAAERGNHSSR